MQKNQLTQSQQLKQVISQQTIQLMKLVELSNNNLEQEIRKEVDENPALEIETDDSDETNFEDSFSLENYNEFDDSYSFDDYDDYSDRELDYALNTINISKEEKNKELFAVSDYSFQEQLLFQLQEFIFTSEEELIAQHIIGCLDNNGYLSGSLDTITTDFLLQYNIKTSNDIVENILKNYVQQLDPAGVGARTLQECLLIQLYRKKQNNTITLASEILKRYFDDFAKKHYEKLQKKLKITNIDLKKAIDEILLLNPRPGITSSAIEKAQQITPDFIITIENGELTLSLNNYHTPKLKLNQEFQNQNFYQNKKLSGQKKREAEKFIKENIEQAKIFINALNSRELVLYTTMYAIMEMQKEYFLSGNNADLKPMILKDIAQKVNLDISTISRVSNSKFVQTIFGIIPLKRLFSESVGSEDTSSKEIKQILIEIIDNEDKKHPLPDEQLCKILQDKGYILARRTVAKYREQLLIPIARLRKELLD